MNLIKILLSKGETVFLNNVIARIWDLRVLCKSSESNLVT